MPTNDGVDQRRQALAIRFVGIDVMLQQSAEDAVVPFLGSDVEGREPAASADARAGVADGGLTGQGTDAGG